MIKVRKLSIRISPLTNLQIPLTFINYTNTISNNKKTQLIIVFPV